ncbi:hypothetical protein, partial [Porcipelethomonas sp.]|uniref:hypothetical protein n=1 Tax=Porcipelethomonas sp. TaxID=2981675 RepID=UPI003EF8B8D4
IFVSFTSVFLILIINSITLSVFSKITSEDIEVLVTSNEIFRVLILFVTKFLYFIFTKAIIKIVKKDDGGLSKEEWIYILCIFVITVIIGNIMFEYVIRHSEVNSMFLNFIFLALIVTDIFSYIFLRKINKSYRKKIIDYEDEDILSSKNIIDEIEIQMDYVNDIKKMTNEHLKTVNYLVKNKFYNEAEQYIDRVCNNDITIPVKSIHTDSKLINLVVNTKLYIFYKNNISINFNLTGSIDVFPEKDICTILAFVFDEITKFCDSCSEPVTVDLHISDNNGYLSIIVTLKSNNIIFDEINKYMENITAENIKNLIKKYSGAMTYDSKPDYLTVNLWLSIDKAMSYPRQSLLTSDER